MSEVGHLVVRLLFAGLFWFGWCYTAVLVLTTLVPRLNRSWLGEWAPFSPSVRLLYALGFLLHGVRFVFDPDDGARHFLRWAGLLAFLAAALGSFAELAAILTLSRDDDMAAEAGDPPQSFAGDDQWARR